MHPERPIEQALRKLAAGRKAEHGPDLELHPATRRLLQGEVARQFTAENRAVPTSWPNKFFGSLWLRSAWSACLIAIFGFFLASKLWRSPSPVQMAKVNPQSTQPDLLGGSLSKSIGDTPDASQSALKQKKAPNSDLSPTEPSLAFAKPSPNQKADDREIAATSRAPSAPPPAIAPLNESEESGRLQAKAAHRDRRAGLDDLATTASPASPSGALAAASGSTFGLERQLSGKRSEVPTNSLAIAQSDGLSKKAENRPQQSQALLAVTAENSQRFVTVRAPAKKDAATNSSVLDEFSLSQDGSRLRVQDKDGSVYLGEVLAREDLKIAEKTVSNRALRSAPIARDAAANNSIASSDKFYFQVSGTNRSLNRRVTFTGNVEASDNLAEYQSTTNEVKGVIGAVGNISSSNLANQRQYRNTGNQQQMNFQNSRVTGTADVEGQKQIEIKAIPSR